MFNSVVVTNYFHTLCPTNPIRPQTSFPLVRLKEKLCIFALAVIHRKQCLYRDPYTQDRPPRLLNKSKEK